MNNPELIASLESFIDSNNLQDDPLLPRQLSCYCWERAAHYEKTARAWAEAAVAIERISQRSAE